MHRVTLIPGDGIGPEVISSCVRVIEATGVKIKFERVDAGASVVETEGTPLPEGVLDAIRRNRIALKGPVTTPIGSGFRSVNVAIRQKLNLYACLRPARSFEGIPSRYGNIDLIVVRENTQGLYSGIERYRDKEKTEAEATRLITKNACERILKFAFDYAAKEGRKKVTAIHKANILKFTDGIFLEVARNTAKNYPGIEFEDRIVDNMCMQLVTKPEKYDVLVTTNLFGDIISDLCAGLVGGLGVAPGANIGDTLAVFEPVHGSAPKYAGKDKANPTAAILSGVMMLKHLDEQESARRIVESLARVLREGKVLTYDLGGSAKTSEFTEYLISEIE